MHWSGLMEVASMEAASSADLTTYRKNEKDTEEY